VNARPGVLSYARDIGSYLIGVALMFKQAGIIFTPPAAPNETMIWIAALLIGVPGVAQIITLRFGTGSQPSQPASSDSSLSSSAPTSLGGGK
jgi:hypothetical protein